MKSESVTFTMSAEFATSHSRTLWSEMRYRAVYAFLWAFGISIEQGEDIIRGKLKFVESDKPNEFLLAKDNWKPNLTTCRMGMYPDPYSSKDRSLMEIENEICTNYPRWKSMDKYAEEEKFSVSREQERSNFNLIIESYMKKAKQDEKVANSSPRPTNVSENGIISPDGDFYKCEYWQHDAISVALGFSDHRDAMDNGYVIVGSSATKGSRIYIKDTKERFVSLPDEQLVTLKQWADLYDTDKWYKMYIQHGRD